MKIYRPEEIPKKCIEHFDPNFENFQQYRVSNEEIFAALQFILDRRLAWKEKLWGLDMTQWAPTTVGKQTSAKTSLVCH